MIATKSEAALLAALREIAAACAHPFGKDARRAKRIAEAAIKRFEDGECA